MNRRESVRTNGKRYKHLLYEDEDIEEVAKKSVVKKVIPEKTKVVQKREKTRKKIAKRIKPKPVVEVKMEIDDDKSLDESIAKALDIEIGRTPIKKMQINSNNQEIENQPLNSITGHGKHFVFPEIEEEEVFAENFQYDGESEEMKEGEILPYTESPDDDLGLSIRGIRLRPELSIAVINTDGYKFPTCGSDPTPKGNNDFADFPPLSPINATNSLGINSIGFIFPNSPKGANKDLIANPQEMQV